MRNLIDVTETPNKNYGFQQCIRSLERIHLQDAENKSLILSSYNLHRSLNSLQSAISSDLANRESGIDVSSSSMEKLNIFTSRPKSHSIDNYYLMNSKRVQHATTQTNPIGALFFDDPYDQMEMLSQYSEEENEDVTSEIDDVDNAAQNSFRRLSFPFCSSNIIAQKTTSENMIDPTKLHENSTVSNKPNTLIESLKATSAPIIMKTTKNSRTCSTFNVRNFI